jgi:lysophospholipase L1-like esterase
VFVQGGTVNVGGVNYTDGQTIKAHYVGGGWEYNLISAESAVGTALVTAASQSAAREAIGAGPFIADSATVGGGVNLACWGDSLTQGAGGTPYPTAIQPLTGYIIYNGGVGGETSTQIRARMIAATSRYPDTAIIWAGRNNSGASATVQADISAMVAALGHNRYLVLSILNGDYPGEESGGGGYNNIIALNNALATTYGDRYIDIRAHLVSLYNPSIPQDVTDHSEDIPPSSLRTDAIHLNTAGYAAVANKIVAEIANLQVTDELVTVGPLVGAFKSFSQTPPPIGSTTPASGAFTTLTATAPAFTGNLTVSVTGSATSSLSSTTYQDFRLIGRSGGSGSGGGQFYWDTTGVQSWFAGQRTDATFATANAWFLRNQTTGTTVLSFHPTTHVPTFGAPVPIDSGGTAATTADVARTNLGLGVGNSPQFASLNVIVGSGPAIMTAQGTTEANLTLIDTGATSGSRVANFNVDGGVFKLRRLNDAANSVLGTPFQIDIFTGAITGGTFNGNTITTGTGTLTLGTGTNNLTGLTVGGGTNMVRVKHGTATLVAGTVTVADATITANSRIFVNRFTAGGTRSASYDVTRTASTSFTITGYDGAGAAQTADTSVVAYQIIEP